VREKREAGRRGEGREKEAGGSYGRRACLMSELTTSGGLGGGGGRSLSRSRR